MTSNNRQRWARVPPHLASRRPGLPAEWVPVLDRNEDAMEPVARPGYVWVDVRGRPLHVWEEHLEFRDFEV